MNAMYIDLAFFAIIILCALIGLWRGFFKTLLGLVGTIVSIIISVYLASHVAGLLGGIGFIGKAFGPNGSLTAKIAAPMQNKWPAIFGVPLAQMPGSLADNLTQTLKLPNSIAQLIAKAVSGAGLSQSSLTLGMIVAQALSSAILWLISALLLFTALRLGVFFLNKLFRRLTKNRTIKKVDRILGFVLGAVKGFAFIVIIFALMSFVIGAKFMNNFNDALSDTAVSRPVSDTVFKWVGNNVNLEKTLKNAFKGKVGEIAPNANSQSILNDLNSADTASLTEQNLRDIDAQLGDGYAFVLSEHVRVRNELAAGSYNAALNITENFKNAKENAENIKKGYDFLRIMYDEYQDAQDPGEKDEIKDDMSDILSEMKSIYDAFRIPAF